MSGKYTILIAKVTALCHLLLMYGCKPDSLGYSNVPEIRLESYEVISQPSGVDSLIQLKIYYQDGDGNIGLDESDSLPPFNYGSVFYHNLPVTYLVPNTSGDFVEVINPSTNEPYGNQHERIPVLTPEGKYKAISGIMTVNLDADPAGTKPSKVVLEIKLIDRDLNISNIVRTDVIELNH